MNKNTNESKKKSVNEWKSDFPATPQRKVDKYCKRRGKSNNNNIVNAWRIKLTKSIKRIIIASKKVNNLNRKENNNK